MASYTTAAAAVATAVLLLCLCSASAAAEAVARSDFSVSKGGLRDYSDVLALKEMGTSTYQPTGARKLLAADQFVTLRPKCEWVTDDGEPYCSPLNENWLQYSGTPSSPYRRAILMATARDDYCSQTHKDRASCYADQANRCYWLTSQGGSKAQCVSADVGEIWWYKKYNFKMAINTVPTALTCPGTKAYDFYSCFARPDGSQPEDCKMLPNCYPTTLDGSNEVCLPKWMKGYSQDQFDELWRGLEDLKPDLYGNCAGTCWIRQAKLCLTKKEQGGCDAVPFCGWNSDQRVCSHNIWEFENEYDLKVKLLYAMCVTAKDQKACEAHSKGAKVQSEASAVWRKYKASTEPVKCKLA